MYSSSSHQVSAQSDLLFGKMSFEDFHNGWHGSYLGYRNRMILAILNLHGPKCGADVISRFSRWLPRQPSWISEQNDFSNSESLCCSNPSHQVSAQSNLLFGRRCRLKNFKMVDRHGGHLGYWTGMILAILNLYVAPMLPIKFWLRPTYCLGDIIWRISRWPPWQPSWISELKDCSNSQSLCYSDASHRFGSIRMMVWEDMSFEEFQDGHLGYRNGTILAILNLYDAPIPLIKFQLNLTYGLGGDVVWWISRWPLWQPSWISEQNNFSNSQFLCHCDASHQVWA